MIFSRTYRYKSPLQASDLKVKLLGKHVKVHNLDFEVFEKDSRIISVIPHAEQEEAIRTLPITNISFKGNGKGTDIVINSKMRKIDEGGPMLIVLFCAFMLIGALIAFFVGKQEFEAYTYTLLGISIFIFLVFWVRMEAGYFDYVRKIRDYIKDSVNQA